jgi:hypothetical protein
MLFTFVGCCGGEGATGIVALLGRAVRVDYIKQSMLQLARDKPNGTTLFFKGLPVNLEAWVRALCQYDVATYVPRWWAYKHSRFQQTAKRAAFARLGVCNNVVEAESVLVEFAKSAAMCGLVVERVVEETVVGVRDNRISADSLSPVTRFRSPQDFFNLSALSGEAVHTLTRIRPTQSLDYEEIIGLLSRGGRMVCTGSRRQTLCTFLVEANDEVFRSYQGRALPHYLQQELDTCGSWPLWSIDVHISEFIFGDPLRGADACVTISHGLRLETLVFIDTVLAPQRRTEALDLLVSAAVNVMSTKLVQRMPKALSADRNIQLTKLLCASVKKRKACAELSGATGTRSPERALVSAPAGWTGTAYTKDSARAPLKCRNAWLMPDGTTVERADSVVCTLRDRRRWPSNFSRCPVCPILHPDSKEREGGECHSLFCKTTFWMSDTCTHFCFRGDRNKRTEVDKFRPLFTDEALFELEDRTDFVLKI